MFRPAFGANILHDPRMPLSLSRDLAALEKLAFKRVERVGPLLTEIHALLDADSSHADHRMLNVVREWLLTPFTLWPIDFHGVGQMIVTIAREGGEIPADVRFLLSQVSALPNKKACQAVATYERLVETGSYESLCKSPVKFDEKEKRLMQSADFVKDWKRLGALFDLTKQRGKKGIIRRSLVQERNFRPGFDFQATDDTKRFQTAFDAFCHRWNLYGMEHDRPLLLKLTVNLTAHGTMIVIPAFWSFDHKRDLDWKRIMKLHRVRGVPRQGPKLSSGRLERSEQGKEARRLWKESGESGLRGDKRYAWIKKRLGLSDETDNSSIRRLRREK